MRSEKPGSAHSSLHSGGESSLFLSNTKNIIVTASLGLIDPRLEAKEWDESLIVASLGYFLLAEESSTMGKFLQFLNLRGRI